VGIPAICVVQGLCGFLCYWIAGIKEPGFWGVITGFTALIPVVGTGLVWVPAAVYLLIIGHSWQGVFVIVYGALILGSMDNVVRFVLAKKMADVHPIVTVLGVILGLQYFGFLGLIFGPLLISYFIILLRIYYVEYQKPVLARPAKKRQLVPVYMQPFLGIKRIRKKPASPPKSHSKPASH
jgi:predicted PurR-regulated permease PerM